MSERIYRGVCVGGPLAGQMLEARNHVYWYRRFEHVHPFVSSNPNPCAEMKVAQAFGYRWEPGIHHGQSQATCDFWVPMDQTVQGMLSQIVNGYMAWAQAEQRDKERREYWEQAEQRNKELQEPRNKELQEQRAMQMRQQLQDQATVREERRWPYPTDGHDG